MLKRLFQNSNKITSLGRQVNIRSGSRNQSCFS